MPRDELEWPGRLDEFRPLLEAAADESGIVLDFLMRQWNGRFATYNVGRPAEQPDETDPRRGVRDEARQYRLIGRVKANTRGEGLHITLSPPSACDTNPTAEDEALWRRFTAALEAHLGVTDGG